MGEKWSQPQYTKCIVLTHLWAFWRQNQNCLQVVPACSSQISYQSLWDWGAHLPLVGLHGQTVGIFPWGGGCTLGFMVIKPKMREYVWKMPLMFPSMWRIFIRYLSTPSFIIPMSLEGENGHDSAVSLFPSSWGWTAKREHTPSSFLCRGQPDPLLRSGSLLLHRYKLPFPASLLSVMKEIWGSPIWWLLFVILFQNSRRRVAF